MVQQRTKGDGDNLLSIATTQNIDIQGDEDLDAVAVEVEGTTGTFSGTIDFQNSNDGANFVNTPYQELRAVTPSRSIAQITSVTSRLAYVMVPPLSKSRIAIVVTSGTLVLSWRKIQHQEV